MTCWLLSLLLATSSFAQDTPISVCREIVFSQDKDIAVLIERIANLEQQIVTQQATIKAWENRASGKVTKKEWAVLVLSVVAAVGTVVGR